MNFIDLVSLVEKHSVGGLLLSAFLFVLYTVVKSEWFGGKMGKLSDWFLEKFMTNKVKEIEKSVRKINKSDIENHDIFNYIDFWVYSKVPTFQYSTEYRTVVFRKYLTVYLKTYKRNIDAFVKAKEYETMDEPQILKSFLNLINQTVHDYEKELSDIGIPNIIIEKMKIKNNDNILLTIDLVEGICSSQFYDSEQNLLKVYSILNILQTVLENTVNNSNVICDGINGALKGMVFNGVKEE